MPPCLPMPWQSMKDLFTILMRPLLETGKIYRKKTIFTTTNFITVEYLDSIHEEMQSDESLLICCKSFQEACESRYDDITVKKILNMLFGRCEFGKEDYSLNVTEVSSATEEPFFDSNPVAESPARKEKRNLPQRISWASFDEEGEMTMSDVSRIRDVKNISATFEVP